MVLQYFHTNSNNIQLNLISNINTVLLTKKVKRVLEFDQLILEFV